MQLIQMTSNSLGCAALPCPKYYSSINYVLLGLAMTHLTGAANWADWDQLSIIPASRRRSLYNATFFPKLGSCSNYGNISHQYAEVLFQNAADPSRVDFNFYDISDKSCLNGWAMGNIAASGMNLAMFFRDLFNPASPSAQLLPEALTAEMVDTSTVAPMTNGWACAGEGPQAPYDCVNPPPQCAALLAPVEGGAMCCGCRDPPPGTKGDTGWPPGPGTAGCPQK